MRCLWQVREIAGTLLLLLLLRWKRNAHLPTFIKALPCFLHPAADSESSTVRRLDLGSGGSQACVGGDALFAENLFRKG